MATDSRTTDGNLSGRSGQALLLDDAGLLQEALRTVSDAASLERAQVRKAELVAEWRARRPQVADKPEHAAEWAAQTSYLDMSLLED